MNGNNFILTEEDNKYLSQAEIEKWANYEGTHDVLLCKRAMARKLLSLANPALKAESVDAWLDSPISELRGSVRMMNVLKSCGFTSIRQVYESGYEYLLRKNSFGLRCKDELVDIFRAHGLLFRAEPTASPTLSEPLEPVDVMVTAPLTLLADMVNACHHNLAHYERQYGRYASRGRYKEEHDRLLALVKDAEKLLAGLETKS
ncbi:hypothetical protein D7B12_18110 [Salmonella enterica]|nr:hypothetical protein [Salmonella enterica]